MPGGLAGLAAHAGASRRAACLLGPAAGRVPLLRAGCVTSVLILVRASAACAIGIPSLPALSQVRELETALELGSRDRTRTYNLPVNSRTLCRLSYAGSRGTGGREPASATTLPGSPARLPLCRRPAYPCRDLRVAYPWVAVRAVRRRPPAPGLPVTASGRARTALVRGGCLEWRCCPAAAFGCDRRRSTKADSGEVNSAQPHG